MTDDSTPDRLRRLAGMRGGRALAETELSIRDMRKILRRGEPHDLDARLRFASAEGAVSALDRLAPLAHEAIIKALSAVLDEDDEVDPEIEVADLLEVVFDRYGTDPDAFVER